MSDTKTYARIAHNYWANINAVSVFSKRIGKLADKHDSKILKDFTKKMEEIFNADFFKDSLDDDKKSLLKKQLDENPNMILEILEMSKTLVKESPQQGRLLRGGALITLISYFELLLADLIQAYYLMFPSALPEGDRMLSLSDLKMIGSIDEAERYLISKEVETVIRKSTKEQLDYFSKRLNTDLKPIGELTEFLIEITQRRNLIVHNDGIVNKTYYLSQVSQELISAYDAKEGEQLIVGEKYLSKAINVVFAVGYILIQQCWRQVEKNTIEGINEDLVNRIYEVLKDEEYELTILLAKYAAKVKFPTDRDLRIVIINYAIALKETNQLQEMQALLSKHDWSSCALEFQVALNVLNDDEETVYELLPKAIAGDGIDSDAMNLWPLFRQLRRTKRFQKAISEYFPVIAIEP